MRSELKTAFEVALFLKQKSVDHNQNMQPQKLQNLLYLAQAYYTVVFDRKLMPAVFIADERGPMEPNIFMAFSKGQPELDIDLFLPKDIKVFLESLWQRFGHMSTDKLNDLTKNSLGYKNAMSRGSRAEIFLDEMRLSFSRPEKMNVNSQELKPKIMRNQSGKSVQVTAWKPKYKID